MLLLLFGGTPAALAADAINVDAATIVNDTARRPVGINANYLMDAERRRTAVPPRTTQAALQDMGVRYLRYPGGEKADAFLWSVPPWAGPQPTLARTGPLEWPSNSRQFTLDDNTTWVAGKEPLDFDEFMTLAAGVGAEPVIVVAYDGMYKALTAGGTRPTREQLLANAVEWVRYANVVKGYNVRYWSIGNETDFFADGNPGAAQYAADVREFSQQMKAVDPTILIGATGSSVDWFQTVLETAAADIDFLDIHDYPNYGWSGGYETFRGGSPVFTTFADLGIIAIKAFAPAVDRNRIKVVVSETGAFDWVGAWPNRNDAGHALVLFDIIGQHLRRPEIDFVQYWNTRWIDNDGVGLPVGTTNLFTVNPGFESNFTGWTVSVDATLGNSSIVSGAGNVHSGTKALRISGATAGGRGRAVTSLVTAGNVYTLSVWAKVTGTAAKSDCGVTFYQGATAIGGKAITVTAPDWTLYTAGFMAPPGFDFADAWCHKEGSTDVLYADDFSLVTGGVPPVLSALGPKNELLASGRVLAIWGNYLHDRLVSSTSTPMVLSYASLSSTTSQLNVFLVNKDTVARETTVTLQDYASLATGERRIFKGASPEDLMPTWAQAADVAVSANEVTLTLDPVSITVLTFGGSPSAQVALATAPANPSVFGQGVLLTATVTGNAPAGAVRFTDGLTVLCDAVALAGGQAQCPAGALAVGSHDLVATYSGDANNGANDSPTLVQVVTKADTVTTLGAAAPSPSTLGSTTTISADVAVVAPGAGTPSGVVVVSDGEAGCVITLPATSCELFPLSSTAKSLTAAYVGDDNFNASTSPELPHLVVMPTFLQALASRKLHGAAGSFDLPLILPPGNPRVEPRLAGAGGLHTIVFTFDKPIAAAAATITEGIATAGAPSFSGNEVIVELTGVANLQYVTVALNGVTAADGATGGSIPVRIGFLAGDVNGSRNVTLADLLVANALQSQSTTATNFPADLNQSGAITVADKTLVNGQLSRALPPP